MTIEHLRTNLQIINEQFEVEKSGQDTLTIGKYSIFSKKSDSKISILFAGAEIITLKIDNGRQTVNLNHMIMDSHFAADLGFALVLVERFLQEWGNKQ